MPIQPLPDGHYRLPTGHKITSTDPVREFEIALTHALAGKPIVASEKHNSVKTRRRPSKLHDAETLRKFNALGIAPGVGTGTAPLVGSAPDTLFAPLFYALTDSIIAYVSNPFSYRP